MENINRDNTLKSKGEKTLEIDKYYFHRYLNMKRRISILVLLLLIFSSMIVLNLDNDQFVDAISPDESLLLSSKWTGFPEIYEDEGPYTINITGPDGLFNDSIELVNLFFINENGGTALYIENDVFKFSFFESNGKWLGQIHLYLNRYGSRSFYMLAETSSLSEQIYFDLEVISVNDPPELIPPISIMRIWQFDTLKIGFTIEDPDEDDEHEFRVNMIENISDDTPSVNDTLPYHTPLHILDWRLNQSNGFFNWRISDQDIWKEKNGWVKNREILLEFEVMDRSGSYSRVLITIILVDINEAPNDPVIIHSEYDSPYVNEEVSFWVDEVKDPDGDDINYYWDFGDGSTSVGRVVSHSYNRIGYRTIQMWVDDGQFQSEKTALRIEVRDGFPPYHDRDRDHDGVFDSSDDFMIDPAASKDSDGDGYPDEWNPGKNESDSNTGLLIDLFPHDSFLNGYDHKDSDEDGVVDGHDDFKYDPAASKDSDRDGYPDEWNPGMTREDSTTELKLDKYPDDPDRNGYEPPIKPYVLYTLIILISFVVVIAISITLFIYFSRKKMKSGKE
jgi:hypothetical protein